MLVLLLLAVLALAFFGIYTSLYWLFIIAAVIGLIWLVTTLAPTPSDRRGAG